MIYIKMSTSTENKNIEYYDYNDYETIEDMVGDIKDDLELYCNIEIRYTEPQPDPTEKEGEFCLDCKEYFKENENCDCDEEEEEEPISKEQEQINMWEQMISDEEREEEETNFKYPNRCSKIWNVEKQKDEWKQYLGAGQYCSPEIIEE